MCGLSRTRYAGLYRFAHISSFLLQAFKDKARFMIPNYNHYSNDPHAIFFEYNPSHFVQIPTVSVCITDYIPYINLACKFQTPAHIPYAICYCCCYWRRCWSNSVVLYYFPRHSPLRCAKQTRQTFEIHAMLQFLYIFHFTRLDFFLFCLNSFPPSAGSNWLLFGFPSSHAFTRRSHPKP